MANTYLTRTQGSPTNNKIFTVSCWFKIAQVAAEMKLIYSDDNSTNNYTYIHFSDTSGRIRFQNRNSSSNNTELIWENNIRDFSAWYHMVMAVDSTQSTASDRVKFYLNGVQKTVLDSGANTYPPINQSFTLNSGGYGVDIGSSNTSSYFQGVMSHFHFCDGTQLAPTVFGETDSTTGQWKIKTSPSFTPGNNGFTILKDGNTITDQSANSNNFTLGGGTLTNTEDCPSNVFATLNPLHKGNTLTGITYSNGNNTFTAGSTAYPYTFSTLANSSGKYYAEFKATSGANNTFIGISAGVKAVYLGHNLYDYSYVGSNGQIYTNQASTNYGSALSTNDILGVAMDLDNNKLYFSINGTWQNSANPSSGTGGHTIVAPSSTTTGVYHFAVGDSDQLTPQIQCNFGNGYFGTTAISSEGTNASGIGKFEYDVPAGYTALSTKGLNL